MPTKNGYDTVANLHLPESPSSSHTGPKHQKTSIQQHSESPNLLYPNTSSSSVPRLGALAQELAHKEFLLLTESINFTDNDTTIDDDTAYHKLINEQDGVYMVPENTPLKERG